MSNLRPHRSLDNAAIALSGLCLVHCLATALIIGAVSSLGGVFGSPLVHEGGLVIAIILGGFALGRGMLMHQRVLPLSIGALGLMIMGGALSLPHGSGEVAATILGVCLLAVGHVLNRLSIA